MANPNHVTGKHYEAIGALIATWSSFEAQMALAVIALSGTTKQAGMLMTVNMNTQALINNLRHLARLKAPNIAGEIDKIIDGDDQNRGLRKIYPVRNLFAHATFGRGSKEGFIKPLAARLREDMEVQEDEFDADGILKYAKLIQERVLRLRNLLEENDYGFDQVPVDPG